MLKVTVLYGHPENSDEFERYYAETHMPLVAKMPHVVKAETTKFVPGPDGAAPPFYRMAEIYYANPTDLQNSMGSPEGQATAGDVPKFATGGAQIMIGAVDA